MSLRTQTNRRLSQRKSLMIVADRFASGLNGSSIHKAKTEELSIMPMAGTNKSGTTKFNDRMDSMRKATVATINDQGKGSVSYGSTSGQGEVVKPWQLWFDILQAMGDDVTELAHGRRGQGVKNRINALKSRDLHLRESSVSIIAVFLQSLVLHPSSEKRLVWMALSLVMILYDVVLIPMDAFDLGIDSFKDSMAWVVAIFWIINLFVSMFFARSSPSSCVSERQSRATRRLGCRSTCA